MAANKRPRKKYSPKRNPLAACRYAHYVPKLAVSNEPLKDREVAEISAPLFRLYRSPQGRHGDGKHVLRRVQHALPLLCPAESVPSRHLQRRRRHRSRVPHRPRLACGRRIRESCRNHRHHRQKIHRARQIYRHGRRTAPVAANRRPLQSRPRNGRMETLRPRHQRIRADIRCRSPQEAEKQAA